MRTPEDCIDEVAEAIAVGILSPELRALDTLKLMVEAGWVILRPAECCRDAIQDLDAEVWSP